MESKLKTGDRVRFEGREGVVTNVDECAGGPPDIYIQWTEGGTEVIARIVSRPAPEVEPADPKARYGATKPSLALVPAAGIVLAALAAEDGTKKYGAYNYRDGHRVEVMTYANAAKRHIDAFIDGQDFTTDTGVPNLGAVIMCCCIIADVMANGFADDNRPAKGKGAQLQDAGKEWKEAIAEGMCPQEASLKFLAPAMGLKP